MTPAETLRRAATLMRQRAQAAGAAAIADGLANWVSSERLLINTLLPQGDAEHIASWHPQVALAVADWLEATADEFGDIRVITSAERDAIYTARAYLGEPDA